LTPVNSKLLTAEWENSDRRRGRKEKEELKEEPTEHLTARVVVEAERAAQEAQRKTEREKLVKKQKADKQHKEQLRQRRESIAMTTPAKAKADLGMTVTEVQQQLVQVKSEKGAVEKKAKVLEGERDSAAKELDEARQTIRSVATILETKTEEVSTLKVELTSVCTMYSEITTVSQAALAAASNDAVHLAADVQNQAKQAQKEVTALKKQHATEIESCKAYQVECEELRSKLVALSAKFSARLEKHTKLEKLYNDAQDCLQTTDVELSALAQDLTKAKEDLTVLREEILDHEAQRVELEAAREDSERSSEELQVTLHKVENLFEQSKQEHLAMVEEMKQEAEAIKSIHQQELQAAHNSVTEAEHKSQEEQRLAGNTIKTLEKEALDKQALLSEKQNALTSTERQVEEFRLDMLKKSQTLKSQAESHTEAIQAMGKRESDMIARLSKELDASICKAEAVEKEKTEAQSDRVKREVREKNLRVELAELRKEKGELAKKLAEVRAALDNEKGSALLKIKATLEKAEKQVALANEESHGAVEKAQHEAEALFAERAKTVEASVASRFEAEIAGLKTRLSEAVGQLSEQEQAKIELQEEAVKKQAAAEALAKEANNLSGKARSEADAKAKEAARVATEAAKKRDKAVNDAAEAQAQKQQRELQIDTLMKRCKDAEEALERQSEEWKIEKKKSKEDYKKEVETVRERLWENRTLDQLVKTTEARANKAEAENKRISEELKLLKQKTGRQFDMPRKR